MSQRVALPSASAWKSGVEFMAGIPAFPGADCQETPSLAAPSALRVKVQAGTEANKVNFHPIPFQGWQGSDYREALQWNIVVFI